MQAEPMPGAISSNTSRSSTTGPGYIQLSGTRDGEKLLKLVSSESGEVHSWYKCVGETTFKVLDVKMMNKKSIKTREAANCSKSGGSTP